MIPREVILGEIKGRIFRMYQNSTETELEPVITNSEGMGMDTELSILQRINAWIGQAATLPQTTEIMLIYKN